MEKVRWEPAALARLVEALFQYEGVSAEDAATIARVQLEADLRGVHSHGMRAVPMYLNRIRQGIIRPRPQMQIHDLGAVAVVDGGDGPGQVSACRAMEECIERARRYHLGAAVVRRSNHFGAAGYYAGMAVASDLIGIATTNGNLVLAPPGGQIPIVGNNPIGIGVPAGTESPLLLDVATSIVAGGKVDLAAAEGDELPDGWCLDAAGRPTRDISAALNGLGIPLGAPLAGHKGFGLALAFEALAGVLAGANFGCQHTREVEGGPKPWDEGHFFLAIDPALTMPLNTFKARMDQLIREVRTSGPAPDGRPLSAPGERGWRRRERALREGILLPCSIDTSLCNAAAERGIALTPSARMSQGEAITSP